MIDVTVNDAGVLRLVLNRPEKRNAINDETMMTLIAEFERAATDDNVRAVLLEGTGADFCSGFDLISRNAGDDKPRPGSIQRRVRTQAHHLIQLVASVQLPVVCKVRGWAAGIGFHLALAADFCVAADDARFWEPFLTRGFTPDSGATWMLPRRVGEVRARELLLLGRELSGVDAVAWGAIHRAVPNAQLDAAVDELLDQLASGPTVATGLTKWLLYEGASASFAQQLENEAFALEVSTRSADFREGMAALREKRAPNFEGR